MVDPNRTIEALWRIESAKLIARLARLVRDLGQAEDLAQDALVAALRTWPRQGIPDNPGAWLMTVAQNRAIDQLRRQKNRDQKLQRYGREWADREGHAPEFHAPDDQETDLLSLVFTACHPVLPVEARVALTLKVVGGLSTAEIARAYLVAETTMAQRIVRAKRTLTEARVRFSTPEEADWPARLDSVLEVVYLMFNEGYSPTSSDQWIRPVLCDEALRLGRMVAAMMPTEPEVHGLVALMEIQASRIPSRLDAQGEPVLLLDQDRSRWDHLLIRRGWAALVRARAAADSRRTALGPYALQAEIAACHSRAFQATQTDWARIAALYDALSQTQPSPIVELNRAVAVAMAWGPEAGLEIVETLVDDPALSRYHWLPSVRGDLLLKTGRRGEAAAEFFRAAGLTQNQKERALLRARGESAQGDDLKTRTED